MKLGTYTNATKKFPDADNIYTVRRQKKQSTFV